MATLLVIGDAATAAHLAAHLGGAGSVVLRAPGAAEGLRHFAQASPDVVLLDLTLPRASHLDALERLRSDDAVVVAVTAAGSAAAVEAMRRGAESAVAAPLDMALVAEVVGRAAEKARLRRYTRYLAVRRGGGLAVVAPGGRGPRGLFGVSTGMRELGDQIELIAQSDRTPVLVVGESGTGKGRVAEAVHALSARAGRPLVALSCAAVSAETLEAELFGYERGTGATWDVRPGLLEEAHGGTVFLDEVGDLGPALQPKLLRVLEGRGFRRAGGTQEVAADVRIIAATGKDLVEEINAGRFSEELYYQLSTMPLYLPPLRARARADVLELVAAVLDELRAEIPAAPAAVSPEAAELLLRYPWPGNVRELRNVLERAMIAARGATRIEPAHLPADVRAVGDPIPEAHVPQTLAEVERAHIARTLRAHAGNRTHAARELGISRATLIKKIREYGLSV